MEDEESLERVPWQSEHIYRRDIAALHNFLEMPQPERDALAERAKKGDSAAREAMLCGLLPMIAIYAARMCRVRPGVTFLDLVSLGNYTIVELFSDAMKKKNPWSYLLMRVHYEMLKLISGYGEPCIATPRTKGVEPYVMIPLHPGLDDEVLEPPPSIAEDYSPLYAAIAALPEYTMHGDIQRELILRLFGLSGFGCESLAEIAGIEVTTGERIYKTINLRKMRALAKMQTYLAQHNPAFVRRHTSA